MARTSSTNPSSDDSAAAIQETVDVAEDKGHLGVKPSPVPNANYTVSGVTAGLPTPETDADMAEEAHRAVRGKTRG